MIITGIAGVALGLAAGYYPRFEMAIMRVMDALMAFPAILLALAVMAALGPSVFASIAALSIHSEGHTHSQGVCLVAEEPGIRGGRQGTGRHRFENPTKAHSAELPVASYSPGNLHIRVRDFGRGFTEFRRGRRASAHT